MRSPAKAQPAAEFVSLPLDVQLQRLLRHIASRTGLDGEPLSSLPVWSTLTRAHKQRLLFALDQRCKAKKQTRSRAAKKATATTGDRSMNMQHGVRMVMRAFGDASVPQIAASLLLHEVVRAWSRRVVAVAAWHAAACAGATSTQPVLPFRVAAQAGLLKAHVSVGDVCLTMADLALLFPVHQTHYARWKCARANAPTGAEAEAADSDSVEDAKRVALGEAGPGGVEAVGAAGVAGRQSSSRAEEMQLTSATRARTCNMFSRRNEFLDRHTANLDRETYVAAWHPARTSWSKCAKEKDFARFVGLDRTAVHRVRLRATIAATAKCETVQLVALEMDADQPSSSSSAGGAAHGVSISLNLAVGRTTMKVAARSFLSYVVHSRVAEVVETALALKSDAHDGGEGSSSGDDPIAGLMADDVTRAARSLARGGGAPQLVWTLPSSSSAPLLPPPPKRRRTTKARDKKKKKKKTPPLKKVSASRPASPTQ